MSQRVIWMTLENLIEIYQVGWLIQMFYHLLQFQAPSRAKFLLL